MLWTEGVIGLIRLEPEFTVAKVADLSGVDFNREYVFLSKTDDELSLVCESSRLPSQCEAAERGWRGLKIEGMLDFGLVGIIAGISGCLAAAGIGLFVVSTYNTDYIFLKSEHLEEAVKVLKEKGYCVA
ncbi:MAG: ACT domain-containing protein [Lachnospiraceae bacterium]|jgi:hypothetical protein|nr:ACT domain-containing protein [Lachnospiraceae bacterium]